MTVTYGFYDSISSDRLYNAKQFGSIFDGIIEDGVYAGIGDKLMVAEDTGMNVDIGSGRAWFDHTWTLNDALLSKTLATADALLDRIDVVYLEVNEDSATRVNSFGVLTGTPASTPSVPALTQTASIHQYPLAEILVGAAVTSIVQDDITNKVGMTATPFVAGIIDYVTTSEVVAQWEAQWLTWFNDIKDQLSTEAETNLQAQIWDLAGVASGAPPYADDMVTLAAHDHTGTHPSINSGGLASGAVTAGKIGTGGVSTASQLAANVVETDKIKNLNVTSSKLGSNSVIAGKIANGAVDDTAILANNIVDDTKVGDRVAQVYRRRGGHLTAWSVPGSTNYTPGPVRIQTGAVETTLGSGVLQAQVGWVSFPVAFSDEPIVIATIHDAIGYGCTVSVFAVAAGSVMFYVRRPADVGAVDYTINWIAIGPE